MGLQTRTLPSIYNGVSQQPAILRSSDQTEDELNTWAFLATGVGKRPPTRVVAQIASALSPAALIHHINRDVSERYIVIIDEGTIRVFDQETGEQIAVNAPGGYSYLADGEFRAVTVADYTFIVNTKKVCGLAAVGADSNAQANYLRWLSLKPTGADYAGFGGSFLFPGATAQYAANMPGGSYKGELPTMEKLPETAPNGDMYKITGSSGTGFTSYYVRRNGAVWDETVANGLPNAVDPATMPHCLIREANGTFSFAPFSWAPRRVGDVQSNPNPIFVGRTIQDVFFYQNRLAFLVDENTIFSCAGDFGNFWRNTILDLIDSDVVDIGVTSKSVSILKNAVTFSDGVFLFSDQTQFSLTNAEAGLAPSSVAIKPVTNYVTSQSCRPVALGAEVYFVGDQNGQSVVYEYQRLADNDSTTASEITAHVPRYIPSGLKALIPAGKSLLALTGGPTLFAYQFYWNGNEKIQSAWRKWAMDGDVLSGIAIGELVYLVIRRNDAVFIESISLDLNSRPVEQPKQVYLDRQAVVTGSYNPGTGYTTFTLPYEPDQDTFQIVRGSGGVRTHSLVDPSVYVWDSAISVRVPGDESGYPCTVGESYAMRIEFSRQFPTDYQGRPLSTGRLQLRTFTVSFADTAFFTTEVQPYGNALPAQLEPIVPAKLVDFTGKVVGADHLKLNQPIYHTGSYSFQIYGDAAQATIAVSNDTHVGSTFVSAEWEGFWSSRVNASS